MSMHSARTLGVATMIAALGLAGAGRLTAATGPAATEPPAIVPQSEIALFDGHTLKGWTFTSKGTGDAGAIWRVQHGVIACAGKPSGYARTVGTYRDYVLHVEWRWPAKAGNSGIFVHLVGPDRVWPRCFEVQLRANDAGSIRANGGSKVRELDPKAKDPINVALRHPGAEKPVGEWNAADITCNGDTISVLINGTFENKVTGATQDTGAIALQAEGAPVEFRNIRVTPLPAP